MLPIMNKRHTADITDFASRIAEARIIMASSRPVASRDGLNKFVRSFEKFATLEDLVDTDSESESKNESGSLGRATASLVRSRSSHESLDFVHNSLNQNFISLCIPKLEGALFNNSLSEAESADNVEVRDLTIIYSKRTE